MIVNIIWHLLQKVVKCNSVLPPQLSYIYWLIHFNWVILLLPARFKKVLVSIKVLVHLVRLTSNHMFVSRDFWDKSLFWFLEILELPSLYLGNSKIFKNALKQFIPNGSPKHVVTRQTNKQTKLLIVVQIKAGKRYSWKTKWTTHICY